jgi:hypothetical protein
MNSPGHSGRGFSLERRESSVMAWRITVLVASFRFARRNQTAI